MSFLMVSKDPAFWWYTVSVAVSLAAAGAVMYLYRSGPRYSEEQRRVFWTWVVFAGITTASVVLGKEAFALVVALVSLFACKEFARATGLYADWVFTGLVYLAILIVNLVALLPGYDGFMSTPIYVIAVLCLLPVLRNRSEGMLQHVALSVMAFVYFGYFLAHLSLLFSVTALETQKETAEKLAGAVASLQLSPGYFFFMLYGTATADLVGWLLGPRLGSHPLAARVSPDTTVEKAIVTLAWAFLWSFTLGWTLPQPAFNWIAMLISAILFGIMGPLGDLVMRYILHDLGLTEQAEGAAYVPYRALSHLNRLIFVAPLFFRLVRYVELHHGTLEIPIRS